MRTSSCVVRYSAALYAMLGFAIACSGVRVDSGEEER